MIVANIDFVKENLVIALIYRQEISLYTRVILAEMRETNTRKVVGRGGRYEGIDDVVDTLVPFSPNHQSFETRSRVLVMRCFCAPSSPQECYRLPS